MHTTQPQFSSNGHAMAGDTADARANSPAYPVRFSAGRPARNPVPNAYSLHGKGSVQFLQDELLIDAKRHRLLRRGVPVRHRIALADIYDARLSGKQLRFDVRVGASDATALHMGFTVPDDRTGLAILNALPPRHTQKFANEQVEHSDFHRRLDTLSPGAPVTLALVAINVVVFALMALSGAGLLSVDGEAAVRWGSNLGALTVNGQWWRLFTSMFIHFGLMHVAFNMFALYQTGRMVERMYGSAHFALLYVFAGLSGSMVSILWHPQNNSAGASGAIFGVFGGLLAFILKPGNAVPPAIINEHRNSTLGFIGFNLLYGFSQANIDNGAHLGGLLGGLVFGLLLARPLDIAARARAGVVRLLLPVLACVLLLGALSYPLWHPGQSATQERRFHSVLHQLPQRDQLASADASAWLGKAKANTISPAQLADAMEQKVMPQWDQLYQSVQEATLDERSDSFALRAALLRYLNDRREACRLIARGVRANDGVLVQQSNQLTRQAQAELATIQKLSDH